MLSATFPESVAAGDSPLAPKIGSGGGYADDSLWSVGLIERFDGGVGRKIADGGFYYAEADTTRGDARLPALVEYVEQTFDLGKCYKGEGDCEPCEVCSDPSLGHSCQFAQYEDKLLMMIGGSLYEWDECEKSFKHLEDYDVCATSMVYFDGYLHVAGRTGRYLWINPSTLEEGYAKIPPDGPDNVTIFRVFGGLLYAVRGNEIWYTNGSGWQPGDEHYPPPPGSNGTGVWEWQGPITAGSHGEPITGLAGLLYQSLGQRYLYVSTASRLFVILPGDLPVELTPWPIVDRHNGENMTQFYNRIYSPVGDGLVNIQSNGDINEVGLDNGLGLPCEVTGRHQSVATAPNWPIAYVDPKNGGRPTLWAHKASSWHFIAALEPGWHACNSFFSSIHSRLFACMCKGSQARIAHAYVGNTISDTRSDPNYRYQKTGHIDVGWYEGALFEVDKLWYSFFVDALCLNDKTGIRVYYTTDRGQEGCESCEDADVEWTLLGEVTQDCPEVFLPCNTEAASKAIRFRVELYTEDDRVTPIIKSMGIRYAPKLNTRLRWAITVRLPWECMTDMTGVELEDYDQAEWDCRLKQIVSAPEAQEFIDIDLSKYSVIVAGYSRRVHNISCSPARRFDIDWSLSLIQVCPEGLVCPGENGEEQTHIQPCGSRSQAETKPRSEDQEAWLRFDAPGRTKPCSTYPTGSAEIGLIR
jgi:hypothetical protein